MGTLNLIDVNNATQIYRGVQANLQRKRLATQELFLEAQKRSVSFALVQEPYVGSVGELKQYGNTRIIQCGPSRTKPVKAAIVVFDQGIEILHDQTTITENIVATRLKTEKWIVGVVSVYFEDTEPLEPYLDRLKEILDVMQTDKILMGGDVNAWSVWWGSATEDSRGEVLRGFLDESDMHILNQGDDPTFDTVRGGRILTSNVDITVTSTNLAPYISNWRVDKSITSSDHNAITFDLKLARPSEMTNSTISTRKYNTRKADWSRFVEVLQNLLVEKHLTSVNIEKIVTTQQLESSVQTYLECVDTACLKSIPKRKNPKNKDYLPWWTDELERLKRRVVTLRRRVSCAAPRRRSHVVAEYLEQKIKYEEAASNAQTASWKEHCTKQDRESLWDSIYRVIRSKTRRPEDLLLMDDGVILSPEKSVELLANTFFPEDNSCEDTDIHKAIRAKAGTLSNSTVDSTDDPPFTEAELNRTVSGFNPKKAPGPDGFTADICCRAIYAGKHVFLGILNKCLALSCFPSPWKEAAVVVLRKPGKADYTLAKSYRPIGLLSIFGKVLEKMLVRRIKWHLLPMSNPRQYGFVPQRSTEDALYDLMQRVGGNLRKKEITLMVSLDIEGAFDSAWWPAIKTQLIIKKCPLNLRRLTNSYLQDRKVVVGYAGKNYAKGTDKGCVQGSIAGPTFWNLLLDPLLDDLVAQGVYVQAFADDVVLIFSGQSVSKIEEIANQTLAYVHEWGIKNKLKFSTQKTHGMVITKKLKYDAPRVHMGGRDIRLVDEIKLLGLTMDRKLTFNSHVSNVCRRVTNIYKQLARTAKIEWGLNPEIVRTIYVAVIEPIIMYASSAWAPATKKIMVQKQLNAVQRGFAQKICKSYRTVSLNAALVLTGLLPLDLRIQEAAQFYEARRGSRDDLQVEGRVCFESAPHPASQTEMEFGSLSDTLPETLEKYKLPETHIYTDGSKIQGKVGAAYTCWTNGVEVSKKKMRLESFCTVYQAELYALYQATEHLHKTKYKEVAVLSDSRSALETVRSCETFHPLAFAVRQNIASLAAEGLNIKWFWIKAHVGVPGNERADELAKEAALYNKIAAHYDKCPASYLKKDIRSTTVEIWGRRYLGEDTAGVTKLFLPSVAEAYKTVKKLRLTPLLTQVLTGHGGFAAYLNRFKCKENPSCDCDDEKDETIQHLLFECPKNDAARYDLESATNKQLTPATLSEMMSENDSRPYLKAFCTRIAKNAVRRNKTR